MLQLLSTFVIAAMGQLIPPPGIIVQAGSKSERALSVLGKNGQAFLAAREASLDISFLDGTKGQGKLVIFFDPSTGFNLTMVGWDRQDSSARSYLDSLAQTRFIATPERLIMISFGATGLSILESTDKATSIDEAERMTLKWHSDQLPHVQQRRISYKDRGYLQEHIDLLRIDFPKGFFNSNFDVRPSLPVQIVDILRSDDLNFDVIMKSTDNQKRCKMSIFRRGGQGVLRTPDRTWGRSSIHFH